MSWIVTLLKFDKDIHHIRDVEIENSNISLGTKAEILALLKKWFPEAEGQNPEWISVDRRGEMSEIILSGVNALADSDGIMSIGFRNPSYRLLRDVCSKMGWKAFDPSEGDFIDFISIPPAYFSQLFLNKQPQNEQQTLVDFIVYLRNQVLETWMSGKPHELRNLAVSLETLGDSFIASGDHTYWGFVDNLAYFSRHADIADYTLYVPTEEVIRAHEA